MPDVIQAIVKGHRLTVDDDGIIVVRNYVVTGLNQNTSALVQAFGAAGLPVYSEPDADFPNIVCRNITFEPFAENSKTQVRVVATFKAADFSNAETPIIRFSACARETVSEFGINGQLLNIQYFPGSGNLAVQNYVAQRRDAKRLGLLEIEQVENNLPSFALNYIGRISGSTWQGQVKHSWYCRNVAFEKRLFFAGYRTFYEFEYDPELHIDTLAYRRAFDGRVPEDVPPVDKTLTIAPLPRRGWINVPRGFEANFNALNLPNVFG